MFWGNMTNEEKFIRTEEEQKRCNEIHDTYRAELLKRQLSNTENYDKAIFSLSSSALALSLTAIKFIIPIDTAHYLWTIKLSWFLFLFTIIFSLGSFLISNHGITKQLSIAENLYIKGLVKAQTETNYFANLNSVLNHITGTLFVLAISMTIFFVTVNINGSSKMSNEKKPQVKVNSTAKLVLDSANIPTMMIAPGNEGSVGLSADIPTMQMAPGTAPVQQQAQPSESSSASTNENSGK